jgi:hypothetical protein
VPQWLLGLGGGAVGGAIGSRVSALQATVGASSPSLPPSFRTTHPPTLPPSLPPHRCPPALVPSSSCGGTVVPSHEHHRPPAAAGTLFKRTSPAPQPAAPHPNESDAEFLGVHRVRAPESSLATTHKEEGGASHGVAPGARLHGQGQGCSWELLGADGPSSNWSGRPSLEAHVLSSVEQEAPCRCKHLGLLQSAAAAPALARCLPPNLGRGQCAWRVCKASPTGMPASPSLP